MLRCRSLLRALVLRACYVTARSWEPWCPEMFTLPLALGGLGVANGLSNRSILGALVLRACYVTVADRAPEAVVVVRGCRARGGLRRSSNSRTRMRRRATGWIPTAPPRQTGPKRLLTSRALLRGPDPQGLHVRARSGGPAAEGRFAFGRGRAPEEKVEVEGRRKWRSRRKKWRKWRRGGSGGAGGGHFHNQGNSHAGRFWMC